MGALGARVVTEAVRLAVDDPEDGREGGGGGRGMDCFGLVGVGEGDGDPGFDMVFDDERDTERLFTFR